MGKNKQKKKIMSKENGQTVQTVNKCSKYKQAQIIYYMIKYHLYQVKYEIQVYASFRVTNQRTYSVKDMSVKGYKNKHTIVNAIS